MFLSKCYRNVFVVISLLILPVISSAEEAVSNVFLRNSQGDEIPLTVEIADTPEALRKGLMFRTSMPENQGMLFVWNDASVRYFWMKNTYIALDILFFNNGHFIGALEDVQPLDETARNIGKPADMALEVNAGSVKKWHIDESWSLTVK